MPASVSAGDPLAGLLESWAGEFSRRTGWRAEPELLGPGALAGARVVLGEHDGLTAGFLSYDEAVTRPLQDLAPYDASELKPAALFPSGSPALIYRPGSPPANLSALRGTSGFKVGLLAPTLRPVPGPTLLALDALEALGAKVELRALPASPGGPQGPELGSGPQSPWAACYLALLPGEFLAIPYEGLEALDAMGLRPGIALALAAPESPAAAGAASRFPLIPDGTPRFSDLGLAGRVSEAFGFYYPEDTGERILGEAPGILAALIDEAAASPAPVAGPAAFAAQAAGPAASPAPGRLVRGLALRGEEAARAFASETEARKALLNAFSLARDGN
jgi:hypothetical protein